MGCFHSGPPRGHSAYSYEPDAGCLMTALRCHPTVVPFVLSRPDFWFFMAIHLTVFFLFRFDYMMDAQEKGSIFFMDWNDVKVITAITTFFEVFYTNQCFHRYLHLYDHVRGMLADVADLSFQLRLYMGPGNKAAWMSMRFAVLGLWLFFQERLGDDSCHELDWEDLIGRKLVTPEERRFLEALTKEQRSVLLHVWVGEISRKGLEDAKAPATMIKAVVSKLERISDHMTEVSDTVNLPVPYQYFHLLNVMIVMNLLVWAIAMGTTSSIFAPIIYYFSALIFMGMMVLGTQLSNPFGDDEVDFPVGDWIAETTDLVGTILDSNFEGSKDKWSKWVERHGHSKFVYSHGAAWSTANSDSDLDQSPLKAQANGMYHPMVAYPMKGGMRAVAAPQDSARRGAI